MASNQFTVQSFKAAKQQGQRITMLTAYDYTTAKLLDQAGMDCLLVGDSLGMVMLGYENTLQVTIDDMIHHCKAVARGSKHALLVGDMPFLTYHVNTDDAVRNAGRFIQEGGMHAVKVEGAADVIDKIKAILKAQIPVLGHLGVTPQSLNVLGGYQTQGKDHDTAHRLMDDALLLQEAGVFGIVLEKVPAALARVMSEKLTIPTIGIGAGPQCDGQVLVTHDVLGMFPQMKLKFAKTYAPLGDEIVKAAETYAREVRDGQFPTDAHSFEMDESVLKELG
jgi:3-methyl-2-oxobutanoate hydroxymethyltransferase